MWRGLGRGLGGGRLGGWPWRLGRRFLGDLLVLFCVRGETGCKSKEREKEGGKRVRFV